MILNTASGTWFDHQLAKLSIDMAAGINHPKEMKYWCSTRLEKYDTLDCIISSLRDQKLIKLKNILEGYMQQLLTKIALMLFRFQGYLSAGLCACLTSVAQCIVRQHEPV